MTRTTYHRSGDPWGLNCWYTLVSLFACFWGQLSTAEDLYLDEVKPLLKTKCWACHGALKQEAGLRLDTGALIRKGGESGPAVLANQAEGSLLIERIAADDEFTRMPPEGEPFTAKQIDILKRWINQGAMSPSDELAQQDPAQHWAFQPIQKIKLPMSDESAVHPIDFFIDRKLSEQGLRRAKPATPRDLIRRLHLVMHGLPPTWEQVQKFEEEFSAEAFHTLIEDVLNSPRYGERWGQYWLDIVRYADTHGFEVNTPRENAWPYRDYVIAAFNEDKPYDQFIREQLAGDLSRADAATGFLVAAAVLLPGQIGKDDASKRLARQDSLDEMIVGTSATFLGLTLGCARCHDHKFDPLTANDYYSMQAFFAGVDYGERPILDEQYQQQQKQISRLQPQLHELQQELSRFQPLVNTRQTLILDEQESTRVTHLYPPKGQGANPPGTGRGYANDAGAVDRIPNISSGSYTWWENKPGVDVITYAPQVAGDFQLWISWGTHGSGVHTRDARYLLDLDGDLTSQDDQTEIANIDQYYFANQNSGESEQKPLWSGLKDTGIHHFNKQTKLIVRGGDTGTGVTADVIVLQAKSLTPGKQPSLREPVNFKKNIERFSPRKIKRIRFTSLATTNNNRYEPCLDEFEVFGPAEPQKNLALMEAGVVPTSSGNYPPSSRHQLKHINDGKYGNEQSWISNEKGKGWVQLEFPELVLVDRVAWGRDRTGKFKDRLPVEYEISIEDGTGNWQVIGTSVDRLPLGTPFDVQDFIVRNAPIEQRAEVAKLTQQITQLQKEIERLKKPRLVYGGVFHEPHPTHLLNRGDPEQPLKLVSPGIPAIFGNQSLAADSSDADRRKLLADWITDPAHPLTARVIVNRIWQQHFGTGLVETPSDFGLNGALPSHPELLDWLAMEFINHNWSIKHLQRLILSSNTWQQSSQIDKHAQRQDAGCRMLWRFPSRRMEAEAIRDCLLAVSGELNLKMGGPGFNLFKSRGGLSGFPPVTEFDSNGLRRMVYAHKVRMESAPIFGAFDCPDAGQPTPKRSQSTTAIQALNLFNSRFVINRSSRLAIQAIQSEQNAGNIDQQITDVYQKILQRLPTAVEQDYIKPVVKENSLEALTRALLNSNEFLMIP